MYGRGEENETSNINVTVKTQDGSRVSITLNRRAKVKKLLDSYCEQKELDVNSVALRFAGYFLRWEQTPNQLAMVDGDEICAFNADSLTSNVPESTEAEFHAQQGNKPCEGVLGNHTLEELEVKATQSLEQAMTFLKASFHKANRLTEDAQNSTEEIKIKYDSQNEAAKKVAEKDLLIEKLHRELQQSNADIRGLNKEQSRRDEELLKVKQDLLTAKAEILRNEVEYCTGKRAALAGSLTNELKKVRPNEPIGTTQCPVPQLCLLNKEDKKSTHVNLKVVGIGKRSTILMAYLRSFCELKGKKVNDMHFIFEGRQVGAQQTPNELGMEDGDMIYAFEEH